MPGKGFKSVGIKEEIYKEIKKRAREEDKSISMYLLDLLEREGKAKGKESILSKVFKINGLTREDLRKLTEDVRTVIAEEIRRALEEFRRY